MNKQFILLAGIAVLVTTFPAFGVTLWNLDMQRDHPSAVTFTGAGPNGGFGGPGDVWNEMLFTPQGWFYLDPSISNLVDSTGSVTGVDFAVTGVIGAYASDGVGATTNLTRDGLYVWPGNDGFLPDGTPITATDADWEISGLTPGGSYQMANYSSGSTSFNLDMTIDTDGDGNLGDETLFTVVADETPVITSITAGAGGSIIGLASQTPGTSESHWSGFQLVGTTGAPVFFADIDDDGDVDLEDFGLFDANYPVLYGIEELAIFCQHWLEGVKLPVDGMQKQLFIDDYVIGQMNNVSQQLNQPVKYTGNPVIELVPPQTAGGDELVVMYGNTIYDEDDELFKMWHEQGNYYGTSRPVAYATSSDGVNWDLPCLGLVSYPNWHAPGCGTGDYDNNLLLDTGQGVHSMGVFKDLDETDPAKRYKMLYCSNGNETPLRPAFSADGIHWNPASSGNWIPTNDSSTTCMWDPKLGKYVAHTRPNAWGTPNGLERQVIQYESDDFLNWTAHGIIMKADENDPLGHRQFYEMPWMQYEDVYIGFMSVFHVPLEGDPLEERIDTQLTFSRDNRNWIRAGNRETFIPNSPTVGDYDYGMIYVMQAPIVVGDEIWIYYSGWEGRHNAPDLGEIQGGTACLAKLRLDGFVSIDASSAGTLTTKKMTMDGDKLVVNADASGGTLKVEVLNAFGNVIGGFSQADCDVISSDNVRHTVTWSGSDDVSSLKGRTILLKFYLDNCKLYSFVFQPI